MKIAIIGGGIGGLTTAIALQKQGFTDVKVYEAAPEIREIGAGIFLAANAMTVFDRLGIVEQMKAEGNLLETAILGDHHGKPLTEVDFSKIIKNYGHGTIAIHRGKLQKVLLQNVAKDTVLLGKRLKNAVYTVEERNPDFIGKGVQNSDSIGKGVTKLTFEDGTTAQADIVIGADGINSPVRRTLFGDVPLRYSGQTCWRGVATMSLDIPKSSAELWGTKAGLRAALCQISENEVYWYITLKHTEGLKLSAEETKPYLMDLVSEFNSPIQKAIQLTDNQHILHNDLSDFKPIKSWYKNNTVLIGDAAHATTPNLGQGACQAVEDAYTLANSLKTAATPSAAFADFQSKRRKKAIFVIKTSQQIGQLTNIGGAIGYRVRNFLMKMTPNAFAEKQFDYLFRM